MNSDPDRSSPEERPSAAIDKPPFSRVWLAFIVSVVLTFVMLNGALTSRRNQMTKVRDAKQAELIQLTGLIASLPQKESAANRLWIDQKRERSEVRKGLGRIKSRDEFPIQSGPQFAWTRLRFVPRNSFHVVLYAPPGEHSLKFGASREVYRQSECPTCSQPAQRGIESPTCVPLPGGKTYDIRVLFQPKGDASDMHYASVTIEGDPNGESPDTHRVPLNFDPDRMSYHQKPEEVLSFCFPQEVTSHGALQQHIREKLPKPVTGLLTTTKNIRIGESTRTATHCFRVWVETDAPACVAASVAAANYRFIASIKNPLRTNQYAKGFNEIFEPYDGSGRYYLRESLFSSPIDETPVSD